VIACQRALGELVKGRPAPFKALWSHADDVVIMSAFGGYERGSEQVSAILDWAPKGIAYTDRSAQNAVTVIGDDLAYTVDLEHMTRSTGDGVQPRTLRCTRLPPGERPVEGRTAPRRRALAQGRAAAISPSRPGWLA
jgi:hypothetical protein